jgi:hypothetical protein
VKLWLVAGCILAIALAPVWSVEIPPMLDYHNHLARQFVLTEIDRSKVLQQFYQVEWHIRPYLAIDATVQALALFIPVALAGKVFLSAMMLLTALGPVTLSISLYGRVTPMALAGLLLVHSTTVSLGFVNFVFASGVALCLFALWVRVRDGAIWVQLAVLPFLASMLFFCHVLGFVIYAVLTSAYELGRHIDNARAKSQHRFLSLDASQRVNVLSLALQFAVPVLVVAGFLPSSPTVSETVYGGLWRKIELLGGALPYLIPPYLWTLDRAVWWALGGGIALLLIVRRIHVPQAMWWPISAMFGLFIATPMALSGGWGADHRMLLPLGLLVLGSLQMGPRESRIWPVAGFVVIALVAVRTYAVAVEWRRTNGEVYATYTRAFENLTDGSRLFFAFGHEAGKKLWPSPVYHLPQLALTKRNVFVPYLFDGPGAIPLVYRPAFKELERRTGGGALLNRASPNWEVVMKEYDFALLINERFFTAPVPKELELIYDGNTVRLYRNLLIVDRQPG